MPRKVNYGLDYDDGYDDYDDYDDYEDYANANDYGVKEKVTEKPSWNDRSTIKVEKKTTKLALWQCSVCNSDNEQSSSSCDICGVLRDPAQNIGNGSAENVRGKCKDSGASIMAKSLFAQSPCQRPEKAIISDEFVRESSNKPSEKAKSQASFDELQKIFVASHQGHSLSIAPFQFNTLSPDDMVSVGKISSKKSSKVSANNTGKKAIAKFSATNEMAENSSGIISGANQLNGSESGNANIKSDAPQILASDLHQMKLDKASTNFRKAKPLAEYKPEKWMLANQDGILNQLNLAVVGHVDSGKSTLSGQLLHLLGRVSKKEMHKFEKEAKEKGKGSFAFAWATDESAEERERGITMTVAVAYFDSKKYRVVLLDSPGHKDFVPNMISGATQADAAVLVVDASIGSFEAGMDGNGFGQTKEHAQLIRSFGVEQVIVAVNKMDTVGFSKERFEFIKSQLGNFLRSCGFKESQITWIPLSAMENENLVTSATDARLSSWYEGSCLLEAVDSLQLPVRDASKPLLLPICDVIKSHSLGQVAACGKIETGAIKNGSRVLVMPLREVATVRSIERDSCPCSVARAGDNVAVSLQGIDGVHVTPGGVLCHPDYPVTVASRLELKILVLDIMGPILVGSKFEFHIHHAKEAARLVKIVSLVDQKTGEAAKKTPRFLTAKQSAIIEVALDRAVCAEEFSKHRALGRAFLRASGCTVGVGIVSKVFSDES
ncbi:HBS1-like protein isoform X2 [Dioscorea cayenensis subsp. rotundata]|uniref:HBS1-like protein isoform X2 n=1 Tax=Dioscorea cayennensis subsp. rotundata TaxID=55577 RepID=A0AB40C7L5_DIOCR|nr:HBS1-like protein isoform X2 [Dioscorea cayenensis subsp. rotundata]